MYNKNYSTIVLSKLFYFGPFKYAEGSVKWHKNNIRSKRYSWFSYSVGKWSHITFKHMCDFPDLLPPCLTNVKSKTGERFFPRISY